MNKVLQFLKYALGPAALAFVIWFYWHKKVDGREVGICRIFASGFEFRWDSLTLALIICGSSMILTFFRWYVLVRAQDLPFTLGNAIQLGMIGAFFNAFLPGSVTGDVPKMVLMAREQSRRTVSVATIMIDRVVGLCGLIWLAALLGLVFELTGLLQEMVQDESGRLILERIVRTTWILVAGSLAFWFLLGFLPLSLTTRWIGRFERIPKLGHPLAELCRATLLYRARGKAVALALLMAIIGHAGFVLTFYFCSLAVNPADDVPSLGAHFLLIPVGMAVQAAVPTPGGMGGGELAYGWLYSQVSKDKDLMAEGVLATILRRLLDFVLGAVGLIAYLRMKPALQAAAEAQRLAATVSANEPGYSDKALQPIYPS